MCSSLDMKYMELAKDLAECLASYRKHICSWCITDHGTELRVRYYINSNKEENLCIHNIIKTETPLTIEEFKHTIDTNIAIINAREERSKTHG